jgi:hypothetical protein
MPPLATPSDASATGSAAPRRAWRSTLGAVAVDAGPPLLIFYVLHALGVNDVLAYTAGSVVPLARLIADRWRGRPFNAISVLVAVFLVASVILALVTDDARAVIARGGLIYLALAVAAAVSVPTRKPLMLLLARYFTIRARPESAAQFDEIYRRPSGLRAMRTVTAVWGLAFGISALACVACAYTLPVTVSATVTSLVEPVIAMALAGGTARYLRRAVTSLSPTAAARGAADSPPASTGTARSTEQTATS